ncbi:hypothetical protein TorRG33x02_241270 [Trema orientale]|uniref:Uncharacterized protein n=1 Tax=Trema orientale TaxID=63057 RepID=A0A2P5DUG9_TREOI|nr:hypothetical protein TorRG33x02_241270 [Trema orientale]
MVPKLLRQGRAWPGCAQEGLVSECLPTPPTAAYSIYNLAKMNRPERCGFLHKLGVLRRAPKSTSFVHFQAQKGEGGREVLVFTV